MHLWLVDLYIPSRRVVEGLLVTADIGAKSGCFIWAKGQPGGNEAKEVEEEKEEVNKEEREEKGPLLYIQNAFVCI